MALSAEQRVQRAHIWLMNEPKYILYSGLFMTGTTTVADDGCPTAYTNGFDTTYGRAFIEKLKDEDLRGLILHENLHKAFRHLTTWLDLYKQDKRLANMACDYVINLMIYDSDPTGKDVRLPEGGCLDEQYRGMDAGTVFRMLKDKQDKESGDGSGAGNDGTETQEGEGFDEHGWDEAQEVSPKQQEEISNQIDQALRQGALLAGKMNGAMPREITELLESKVDWREALRDFITTFCAEREISTWRRPNRRWVDRDVYLPSAVGESVGRLVIGADMSGSMNAVLGKVLGEIAQICKTVSPEAIDLIYWDTHVCQHEVYDRDAFDSLITSTKPKGGGGTSPQCVSDYIRDKKLQPEAIIMLTDGYVDTWGTHWNAPILWGVTTKGKQANVGLTIYIGD